MDKIQKQILECLDYLLWVSPERSEKSKEIKQELMTKNLILINNVGGENTEPCCDMEEFAKTINAKGEKE